MGGGEKNYPLEDLFEVRTNPQLDKRFFEFKEDGEYPYFTRTVLNNGISWYTKYLDDEHLTKGNCIAVGMLWMQFFYMKKDFYSWQFTKSLFPKFKGFNSTLAQFFIAHLNKKSKDFQSVLVKDFTKKINNTEIILPTLWNWELAYEYMENYIKEIEKYHIEELREYHIKEIETYLKATGLSDYELFKDEVESLKTITQGEGRKFRLDELFDVRPSKYHKITNDILFENDWVIPVISNTNLRNWIMWYSNQPSLNEWNILTCSDTTIWADTMFYQKQGFIGYSHIQTLIPKDKFNEYIAMFIISLVRKATWNAYNYWTKFNRKAIWNTEITLPVNSDNQINLSLIESYITATQKLVIKDLVDNINEKLKTYKEII